MKRIVFAPVAVAVALSLVGMTGCGKKDAKDGAMMNDSSSAMQAPATSGSESGTMTSNPATTDSGAMSSGTSTENPMVGGAPMYANKDIVDNAVNSKDHTTLVAAVQAAGLVETLKGAGPFTVFAPTNDAFAKLPAGTVETLVKPENKEKLTGILTYHVVAGKVDAAELKKQIEAGGGKASLKTVSGGTLTAAIDGGNVVVTDAKGGKSTVTTADVYQSNGVIHVVDAVLMPE